MIEFAVRCLSVDGTAIRTPPLALDAFTAMTADVVCAVVEEISPESKDKVGRKQQVAYIIKCGYAEDNVVDGTYTHQSAEVENGIEERQVTESIVDGSDGNDEHAPYRREKDHQQERLGKGVECGVKVEVSPSVRCKELNGGVQCGR